ncbi:hypothetical protein GCM10027456_01150 [Kineosporia babensis]
MVAIGGGLGLLLILAFGAVALIAVSRGEDGRSGSGVASGPAPFQEAVNSLKEAEGMALGSLDYNVRMSRHGDLTGTYQYNDTPIVRIDGATYLNADQSEAFLLLPSLLSYEEMPDETWTRISDASLEQLHTQTVLPASPAALAERLASALADPETDFAPDPFVDDRFSDLESATEPAADAENTAVMVNDVEAFVASTPQGRIYVTKAAPHTLLHVTDGFLRPISQTAAPSAEETRVETASFQAADLPTIPTTDGVDVLEMNAEQVGQSYADLIGLAPQLKTTPDARFEVITGRPDEKCSATSCSLESEVKVLSSDPEIAEDKVRVRLDGRFIIDFNDVEPFPCSSFAEMTVGKAKSLSCSSKAGAKQYGRSGGAGTYTPLRSQSSAGVHVELDVEKALGTLQQRHSELG